ncbi:MAG TPA: flagellar biosynthesis protein FlhF [bacterium]|nr:flagellar biosynthesis protein FlhF [bacterium]
MRVKKYVAEELHEALRQLRAELGPEAMILQTKPCEIKRFFGLIRRTGVEVTAGVGMNFLTDLVQRKPETSRPVAEQPSGEPAIAKPAAPTVSDEQVKTPEVISLEERMKRLEAGMLQIQDVLGNIRQPHSPGDEVELSVPTPVQNLFRQLCVLGFTEDYALQLTDALKRHGNGSATLEMLQEHLIGTLTASLSCVEPLQAIPQSSKVIALIGPTGVGKTTTLAKLSASFCLHSNKRIAMITTDTYRLAATDQLQRYADILGVPLEIVYTPEEMRQAIDRLQDVDVIFVDTAGRSQKNLEQMSDLKRFLEAASPAQVHLLLSATTKYDDLMDVITRFELVPLSSLIITKTDESNSFGAIASLLKEVSLPVSYLTTGQNVPEDIEKATPDRLARLFVLGLNEAGRTGHNTGNEG